MYVLNGNLGFKEAFLMVGLLVVFVPVKPEIV